MEKVRWDVFCSIKNHSKCKNKKRLEKIIASNTLHTGLQWRRRQQYYDKCANWQLSSITSHCLHLLSLFEAKNNKNRKTKTYCHEIKLNWYLWKYFQNDDHAHISLTVLAHNFQVSAFHTRLENPEVLINLINFSSPKERSAGGTAPPPPPRLPCQATTVPHILRTDRMVELILDFLGIISLRQFSISSHVDLYHHVMFKCEFNWFSCFPRTCIYIVIAFVMLEENGKRYSWIWAALPLFRLYRAFSTEVVYKKRFSECSVPKAPSGGKVRFLNFIVKCHFQWNRIFFPIIENGYC